MKKTDTDVREVNKGVLDQLRTADSKEPRDDTEFWLHRGLMHIAKVYPNAQLNRTWHRDLTNNLEGKISSRSKTLKASVLDGNVMFEHQEAAVEQVVAKNEAVIQIHFSNR